MAEEEQTNEMTEEDAPDIESRIKLAMRSRIGHFKEQAEYEHLYLLSSVSHFALLLVI